MALCLFNNVKLLPSVKGFAGNRKFFWELTGISILEEFDFL